MLQTIFTIIGGIASAVSAYLAYRAQKPILADDENSIPFRTLTALAVLALGFATTALIVGAINWNNIGKNQFQISQVQIQAHTIDQFDANWSNPIEIPRFPDDEERFLVEDKCGEGYTPQVAWHSVGTEFGSGNLLYTTFTEIDADQQFVTIRANKEKSGYAYIDVYALCLKK